jgi:hypothetical protein
MADKVVDAGKFETTGVFNKQYRTFVPGNTKNAAETFNELSHLPKGNLDLGDGRTLCIQGWKPEADEDTCSGFIRITVKGYIRKNQGVV